MGPWGVGAMVAHYLLVLICYKYNVNTGVRRNAEQNFGHPYHYLIDQIQIAVQKIFNALVYPRHFNVSLFEPVKDFVSVGIGPLTYSSDFVTQGAPLQHLKGDMRFIAERMKVACPPLEPISKEELSLINKHFVNQPKQTNATLNALAKQFLQNADGIKIFPKLASQLKAYLMKWKQNNLVKQAIRKMGLGGYEKLLHSLASRRMAVGDVASFDATQINALPENPLLRLNNEFESLVVHQYVPPIVAPMQEAQVFTGPNLGGTSQQHKWCVYYPYCDSQARICGGTHKDGCRKVIPNRGRIEVPSWEQLGEEKLKIKNAERAGRAKRQKTATATTTTTTTTTQPEVATIYHI